MTREQIGLDGLWRFQPDTFSEGRAAGYHEPGHDTRYWREVTVPATFDRCGPGMASYEGAGWFRRTVDVPAQWSGRRVTLGFGGVNYACRAWVNGREVGSHGDGFLPFAFPVHDELRCDGTDVVVVCVDNARRPGDVPGKERGWRPYGGILREVTLEAADRLRIESVRMAAAANGTLSLEADIANDRAEACACELAVTVEDGEGRAVASLIAPGVDVETNGKVSVDVEGSVAGARPWSTDAPALYTARVTLAAGGVPVDERAVRFGFRDVEARDGKVLLNGDEVFLLGFNRHEDSPHADMCADLAQARRDLEHMKSLGANWVRLCHYPHHPGELDLCDELGLMVMAEIPLYWWNGLEEGEEACARKLAAAERQVTAMVARDRNHPSVVMWSVSNETHEQRSEVVEGNAQLVRLAKRLDPTRLVTHVSDHWRDHPHFEDDDVMSLNAYPSWSGRGWKADPGYDFGDSALWWRDGIARMRERYPGKPVLISEFGYPALEKVRDNGLGEDAQAAAIEAEFGAFDAASVCGATVWCYADHPWPEEPFISYLTTSPFGVVTRDRRRKAACATVGRLFARRRGFEGSPPRPFDITEEHININMIRPHMRDIPVHEFPAGYSVRPMRPGEGAVWNDIQRDAGLHAPDGGDLFASEFGEDLPACERRVFFIVDERGAAVGTIASWYSRDFKGADYGRIHWFAIRPAYRGRKLAKPLASHALCRMAEWHERAWLLTQTSRIAAIKIYLDFGFTPDLEPEHAVEAWKKVAAALDHRGLDGLR